MAVHIVAYDLNKEIHRPNIVAEVKKTSWARLSESSYAIDTNERPSQVMDRFRQYIDQNDNLYVVTLTAPWSGFGPQDVIDWMRQRLGPGE